jgi:hypothetical protein
MRNSMSINFKNGLFPVAIVTLWLEFLLLFSIVGSVCSQACPGCDNKSTGQKVTPQTLYAIVAENKNK